MKKYSILDPYKIAVGSTISLETPLKRPQIDVKLSSIPQATNVLKTGGIEVGKCTKIGTHLKTFNELIE